MRSALEKGFRSVGKSVGRPPATCPSATLAYWRLLLLHRAHECKLRAKANWPRIRLATGGHFACSIRRPSHAACAPCECVPLVCPRLAWPNNWAACQLHARCKWAPASANIAPRRASDHWHSRRPNARSPVGLVWLPSTCQDLYCVTNRHPCQHYQFTFIPALPCLWHQIAHLEARARASTLAPGLTLALGA